MKYFLFLFLIGTTHISFSQRLEITTGPILNNKDIRDEIGFPKLIVGSRYKSYTSTTFFNPHKKLTYSGFGFHNKEFHFAVLEDFVNYSGVKKLTAESITDKVNLRKFIAIDDKTYVIYSQEFPELDEFTVYVSEVSEDMVVLGTPLVIQNYKKLNQYGKRILVSISENKKHILIYRFYNNRAKEKTKIDCRMVNQSFSETWSNIFETEGMDKDTFVRSTKVDNSGNIHMLINLKVGKLYKPQLYSYFWKDQSLKVASLGLPDGKNYGTKLEILNGEKPYVVGLNENRKRVSCFVDKLDIETKKVQKLESVIIPEEVFKVSNFRLVKTGDWKVTDIVYLNDHSVVASIEALKYTSKGIPVSTNTYVVSFNEAGAHKWSRTIRKKQAINGYGFVGHLLLPAGSDVLVIYNDNPANYSLAPSDKKVKAFMGTSNKTVVQEIDGNGNVSKYAFTTDKDLDGWALYLDGFEEIEKNLYFTSFIYPQIKVNLDTRNITIKVN